MTDRSAATEVIQQFYSEIEKICKENDMTSVFAAGPSLFDAEGRPSRNVSANEQLVGGFGGDPATVISYIRTLLSELIDAYGFDARQIRVLSDEFDNMFCQKMLDNKNQ